MRCLKDECLERIIFFGEKSLQAATVDFPDHFHAERNRSGNREPPDCAGARGGRDDRRNRGLIAGPGKLIG